MSAPVGTVLVDARPVDHPTARQRGIGRYVTGLLRGLHDIDAPVIALHGSDIDAGVLRDAIPGLPLRRWSPQVVREHARADTWYVATQLMLHPIPLDPIPSVITEAGLPVAAVMYDVIPYRFPEQYQVEPNARIQAQLRAPLARTVDAMLAISEFSATTAAAELRYPLDRIAMIGAGVEAQFVPPDVRRMPPPDRVLPADVGRYVVAVTGGDERKNTEGLLRAWGVVDPAVRRGRRLVIATAHSPSVLRRWEAWAADAGITDDVTFTGSVTDDEMVAILQGAELAVMPSVEEGFGLPVVEAAACGCPVICSNVSSLPEVLAEPLAEFDPFDPASIARAIERALDDPAHRRTLHAAAAGAADRWTWERVATDTMAALADLGPRWDQRARSPARRVALAGPFAGSESGIGQYDEQIVAALHRRPTNEATPVVEALVDASATSSPDPTVDGRWLVRALGRYVKPWRYDHIVAALGSSPHHVATADLAEREPCHVWLHEASLVGVHVGLAHSSGSESWARGHVRAVLDRAEPAASRARVTDDLLLDAPHLDELGVTMLGTTLARARSVIVSSDGAATTVRGVRPDGPPLLVLPLAYPTVVPPTGPPAGGEILAVGWLAPNKAPEVAVAVLERLCRDHDTRLTFVGPARDDTRRHVVEHARALGVEERVSFTGRLDAAEYERRIGAGRVGLQLRVDERGEMSAAIADLVAHGIPTVTTMQSAAPSSPGLAVVALDADRIAEIAARLLDDDDAWATASTDALARAARWTFDDVAGALLEWLDDVDGLEPTTIRRRGPAPERTR